MKKPTRYSDQVHSFLNAATGKGRGREGTINLLVSTPSLNKVHTKELACLLYDYYCAISKGCTRQTNYTNAVTKYTAKLG